MSIIFIFLSGLLTLTPITIDCYSFEAGYAEIWYQIPISNIYPQQDSVSQEQDSIFIQYTYYFNIHDKNKNDSSSIQGIKGTYITTKQYKDCIIDYFPIYLYPGSFHYSLNIESDVGQLFAEEEITIPSDTNILSCSDVILGRKKFKKFIFHELAFTPSITSEFTDQDTLISYLEIYELIPDSLHYNISYQIIDSTNSIVFENNEKRLKYSYNQVDTISVSCGDFIDGNYTLLVEVYDPALDLAISRSKTFSIVSLFDEISCMKYYYDIQYIISPSEYKKFSGLTEHEQKVYLKKFWSENDYWQFERHVIEADAKFSTRSMKGRDSERGKFYIKNGPPDDIEDEPFTGWARPFEIWYYSSKDYALLFCDMKSDGNPSLIKTLKPGEYSSDEKWLFDLAPALYDLKEVAE